jgi:hypothetical protein
MVEKGAFVDDARMNVSEQREKDELFAEGAVFRV